jgi:hypothetical protein
MTPEKKEKIFRLITSLKALSVNNLDEEEAALAAARMQGLIDKYKISEAELNVDDDDEVEVDCHSFYEEGGNRFVRWRLQLAVSLAHNNNCRVVKTQGSKSKRTGKVIVAQVQIIGTEGNVATCKYVFMYLCNEIERLSKEALVKYNRANPHEKGGKGFSVSFKVGAVMSISKRLREQRRETVAENETAMVLFDKENRAVDDWMKENLNLPRTCSPMTASSRAGYSAGQAAGKNLTIGPNSGKAVTSGPKALPR